MNWLISYLVILLLLVSTLFTQTQYSLIAIGEKMGQMTLLL